MSGSVTCAAARCCSAGCTASSALLPGHPDLYDAIRRGQARQAAQSPAFRLYALAAAVAALPLALAGTVIEVATRVRRHHLRRGPAPGLTHMLVDRR